MTTSGATAPRTPPPKPPDPAIARSGGPALIPSQLVGMELAGPITAVAVSAKGNRGVVDPLYWAVAQLASDGFSREQQLRLAKTLAGLNGATVSFPNARESAMRGEMLRAAQKGQPKATPRPQAKPENKAMKSSPEQTALDAAHKALREKRTLLGLAKNDTTDARLSAEVAAVKAANAAFQAKKAAFKAGGT